MEGARRHGIKQVWDICHFGYPRCANPHHRVAGALHPQPWRWPAETAMNRRLSRIRLISSLPIPDFEETRIALPPRKEAARGVSAPKARGSVSPGSHAPASDAENSRQRQHRALRSSGTAGSGSGTSGNGCECLDARCCTKRWPLPPRTWVLPDRLMFPSWLTRI